MDESKFIRKPQPSIEEQNLGGINKSMEDELEKYDRLLAKEGISDGERKAYEDNKQFIQDGLLEIDNAKEWMKLNPGKGWDDYMGLQFKTWHEKMQNSPESFKPSAEKKYKFYQKLGSRFSEQDVVTEQVIEKKGNNEKTKALFEAFKRGGGSPEVQEAKLRLKDLEQQKAEILTDKIKGNPYDEDILTWLDIEIKLWQRQAEGKPIEGETEEEKEEYRIHTGRMTKEEFKKVKAEVDKKRPEY